MSTPPDSRFIELHSQHTLQYHDLLTIYNLAKDEGMAENIDSFSFNDLLGLTIHLFVTTQSQRTREQLSQQLPKFGSSVVLPLIKILCHKQLGHVDNLHVLTQKSLDRINPHALLIGLNRVLTLETDPQLGTAARQIVKNLIQTHDRSVLFLLSKLIFQEHWLPLNTSSFEELPSPMVHTTEKLAAFNLCRTQ